MAHLQDRLGEFTGKSALYETPCFPPGAGPDYVNAAVALRSDRDAREILAIVHAIEADFGRERNRRWGMRTLDIDLIAAGGEILPSRAVHDRWRNLPPEAQVRATPDEIVLPHPRLQDRAFVLVPLADVAPDWRHPILDRTVRQLRDALPADQLGEIRPLPYG